jgi:hypothetical protein
MEDVKMALTRWALGTLVPKWFGGATPWFCVGMFCAGMSFWPDAVSAAGTLGGARLTSAILSAVLFVR